MKIITIWVWAFWFALLSHLGTNNPEMTFYAYEKNQEIYTQLWKNNTHPYFFKGKKLPKNITLIKDIDDLTDFDMIILALPAQFIWDFIKEISLNIKPGVIFLNVAKWIDNQTLQTPQDIILSNLWDFPHKYGVLSWWMIAKELVDLKPLWANISINDQEVWIYLQKIFSGNMLEISLGENPKNTQLYGSIKNIFALYVWFLEGKWLEMSSIWYYFCKLYKELPDLLETLGWEKNTDFSSFSLGGDLLATCFWDSRNRYFWKIVWGWKTPMQAYEILTWEKKHSEGYATLSWLKEILKNEKLREFQKVYEIFYQE